MSDGAAGQQQSSVRQRRLGSWLPLAVFLCLVILLAFGLRGNPNELPSARLGKPAPAFALPDVSQPEKILRPEDFHGQVWILNVWASWCAACLDEHRTLSKFAAQGVVPVVGLNHKDQRDAALAWLGRHGNPWLLSGFDRDGKVGIDYGVYGVPETFVIDRHGTIRLRHAGPLSTQVLERKLLPLISELKDG